MASADQDLLIILSNFSIPVSIRMTGWEYLLSLTGSEEGVGKITDYEKYGVLLASYVKSPKPEKETKELAYKVLLNLSSSSKGASFILKCCKDILVTLLQEICAISDFTKVQCSLLSNLSNHTNLLNIDGFVPMFSRLWEEKLGAMFCSPDKSVRELYAYLALFFSNLSGTCEGRKLLVENDCFFQTFLTSLDPEEADSRRLGIALTFRNCCSETSLHGILVKVYNILPVLLKPLMKGGVFKGDETEKLPPECQGEKVWRERVPQVRKAIIQALSMMCYTEEGWNYLKSHGVYYVCREFHLLEPDTDVKEAVETLVGYMLVEQYGDANVNPGQSDQLLDIPDFLLSKAENLPVLDAHSSQDANAMRGANDSQWYSS